MNDPMETMIEGALRTAGLNFTRDDRNAGRPQRGDDVTLDFHLVDLDIYIEVKRYHSERTGRQLSMAPNVILAQGETAIRTLADMIAGWKPQGASPEEIDYEPPRSRRAWLITGLIVGFAVGFVAGVALMGIVVAATA